MVRLASFRAHLEKIEFQPISSHNNSVLWRQPQELLTLLIEHEGKAYCNSNRRHKCQR